MNAEERMVSEYLAHRGFRGVVYEPDGKVPPDFLVNRHIAVEVRRLNQNEDIAGERRGLEEVAIPLQAQIRQLLRRLGSATSGETWFVSYRLRRPLPPWTSLAKALRSELSTFRDGALRQPTNLSVVPGFRINLDRAGRSHSDFFVPAGYVDSDSGGFVLSELNRNIRICVAEKTKTVARVRHKYGEWWLALVDRIGYGLSSADVGALRQLLQLDHSWDKIIIVNPLNPTEGHEL